MRNQNEKMQTDAAQEPKEKQGPRHILLDRAFPPTWLLGGAILMVITLSLFSGWKVFHLELERSELLQNRAILEKEKEVFSELTRALPQLQEQHQELAGVVAELEGRRTALGASVETANLELENRQKQLQLAIAERNQAEAAAQAAREEYGRLTTTIQQIKSQMSNLRQQVEALSSREQALRDNAGALQEKVATLEADLKGLQRQRSNEQKILEQMTADRAALDSLNERILDVARKLEATGEKAGLAVQAFDGKSSEVDRVVADIKAQSEAVSIQAQELSSATQTAIQATDNLSKIGDSMGGTASNLSKAVAAVDAQAQSLTRINQGPLSGLTESSERLKDTVAVLSSLSRDLGNGVKVIRERAVVLEEQEGKISQVAESMGKVITTLQIVDGKSSALRDEVTRDLGNLHNVMVEVQQNLEVNRGGIEQLMNDTRARLEALTINLEELNRAVMDASRIPIRGL